MISNNEKISIRQVQILTILNVLGTSLMLLPKYIGVLANEDSYISVIIGVFLALISITLICASLKKHNCKNFYFYLQKVFGKPIGFLILMAFILTIIIITGNSVKTFGEVFADVMLPKTPTPVVTISILLISAYAASKGLEARGRLGEIIIYFVVIFLLLTIFFVVGNFDYKNFLPILKNNYVDTLNGGLVVFFGFSGILYTYVAYFHIDNSKELARSVKPTVLLIGLVILIVVVVMQGTFGIDTVNNMRWPLLELISSVETNGSFVERQDAIVMSFWIFIAFASINAGIYYTSYLVKCIAPKFKSIYYILFSIALIFTESIFTFGKDYLVYLLIFFMAILPIAMILSSKKVITNLIIMGIFISQTGCEDKISLENRSFPLTIGIDKIEDEFFLTYSIPVSIKPGESQKIEKISTGKTLDIAINKMEKMSDKFIDYRHVKTIIFGKDFLNDRDMMKEVLTKINHSPLNNKTLILGTDTTVKELIESQSEAEEILGQHIQSYYRDNNSIFNMELLEVSQQLKDNVIVIPKISFDDTKKIQIEDGIILEDYKYVDELNDKYTLGYMTFLGIAKDTPMDNGGHIISNKSHLTFDLDKNNLIVTAKIKVVADKKNENLENEIYEIWDFFYEDLKIDGFNLKQSLRRNNYEIYLKRDIIESVELKVILDYKVD